jgi:hypothetical protein
MSVYHYVDILTASVLLAGKKTSLVETENCDREREFYTSLMFIRSPGGATVMSRGDPAAFCNVVETMRGRGLCACALGSSLKASNTSGKHSVYGL